MTKKIKKSLLVVSLLATSFLACGAVASVNAIPASATEAGDQTQTETVETIEFATDFGASVRITEPNGIRFKLKLSDAKKGEIFAENSNKLLGMYIFLGSKVGTTTDYSTLSQKLDVKFKETDLYKVGDYWYANGVMTDLYIQNFNKQFVGVGYIATTGETTTYEYSDFNVTDNVRSMSDVAIEAYKDPDAAAHKGSMAKLIEKAAYAEYGVVETRTAGENDTIVYSFAKGEDTWASYEAMQTAIPVSLSASVSDAALDVGETTNLTANLVINGTAITTLNVPFEYTVSGDAVTIENGVISAMTVGTSDITVSFGDYSKTVSVNVIDYQERNHLQGHPDLNMFGQTATVSLVEKQGTFNGFGTIEGEIESLCLSDGTVLSDMADVTLENGVLTFTTTESSLVNVFGSCRGGKTVVLTTHVYDENETLKKVVTHNFYMTFADYVITTYEEYRQLSKYVVTANTTTDAFVTNTVGMTGSVCTNGYFVLGNDLAFAGKNVLDSTNAKAVSLIGGTFDGQGYTMDQPLFSDSSLFGVIRNGATVKDVKITNAKVAFGNNETVNAGIIATVAGNGFKISNVYVDVNLTGNPTKTSGKRFGFIGRQANYGNNSTCLIEDCTMLVSVTGLTGAMSTQMGVWVGDNTDNTYKNSSTSTTSKYATVTMKNCISVITDTNASGYTVSKVGSLFYTDSLTETNCGNYASWTEYEATTLTNYNADMLAFIESCKA